MRTSMDPRKDLIEENCKAISLKLDKGIRNRREVIEHIAVVQEMMPLLKEFFSKTSNFKKQNDVIEFLYKNSPDLKKEILCSPPLKSLYRRNGILSKSEFMIVDVIVKIMIGVFATFMLSIIGLVEFSAWNLFATTSVIILFSDFLLKNVNFYRVK